MRIVVALATTILTSSGWTLLCDRLQSSQTPEIFTAAVNGRIGVPDGEPLEGFLPMTPLAKRMLELSYREALRLGRTMVGSEHIALGGLRGGGGLAAEILGNFGVTYDALRTAATDT